MGNLTRTVLWASTILLRSPGVFVHEWAHYVVCRLLGVRVQEYVPIRFGSPPGYVTHAVPNSYLKRVCISVAPLLVNTAIGIVAFWASTTVDLRYAPITVYLGAVAIGESIPSSADARNLLPRRRLGYLHPLFVLALPLIAVILLVNRLRAYGVVLLYTAAVSVGLLVFFHTDVVRTAGLLPW